MLILVITTGGTIGSLPYSDPRKPPISSSFSKDGSDFVRNALSTPAFGFTKTRVISLEPKDSKDIDAAYIEKIANLVKAATEDKILITHGSDRILKTAEYFHEQLERDAGLKNKIIVLTGSMVPLANGNESDGYANLKFSLEQLSQQSMKGGVYIVLSDYAQNNNWSPHLYRFEPGKYEKAFNTEDGRYHRLVAKG